MLQQFCLSHFVGRVDRSSKCFWLPVCTGAQVCGSMQSRQVWHNTALETISLLCCRADGKECFQTCWCCVSLLHLASLWPGEFLKSSIMVMGHCCGAYMREPVCCWMSSSLLCKPSVRSYPVNHNVNTALVLLLVLCMSREPDTETGSWYVGPSTVCYACIAISRSACGKLHEVPGKIWSQVYCDCRCCHLLYLCFGASKSGGRCNSYI